MKEEKKKSAIVMFAFAALCAVLAVLYVISASNVLFGSPVDINDLLEEDAELEGEYVTIGVDAPVDWFAETKHYINGIIPAGKEKHCVVWLDDDTFIAMTVKGKSDIENIDEKIEELWAYLTGTSTVAPTKLTFKGTITNMNPEIEKYYNEAFEELQFSSEDMEDVRGYTIDTTQTKGSAYITLAILVIVAIGLVCAGIGIMKQKKKKKSMEASYSGSYSGYSDPNMNGYATGDANNPIFGDMYKNVASEEQDENTSDPNNFGI